MYSKLDTARRTYRREGLAPLVLKTSSFVARCWGVDSVTAPLERRRYETPEDFDAYEHPPNPFRVLWVSPDDIQSFTGREYPPYRGADARLGVVRDGDWDRTGPDTIDSDYEPRYELYRAGAGRFCESVFCRSLEAHFVDGVPWDETAWYRHSLEIIDDGGQTSKSITTEAGLGKRCEEIDRLFETIDENGYLSQRSLGNFPAAAHEVIVDIGRDGELLFVNGRNRLAIAKILGIEAIPVGVYVRHHEWMTHRDAVANDGRRPAHPDLADLFDDSSVIR